MPIFSALNVLFAPSKRKETRERDLSVVVAEAPEKLRKTIFLNAQNDSLDSLDGEERKIVMLGASTGKERPDRHIVQKLKNGTDMNLYGDGSFVVKNAEGVIIKTCDVMRVKREFAKDPETGKLMVKRFGLWTKFEKAYIDDHGNLFWSNGEVSAEERLNGLHVQRNDVTGVMIQTHHKAQLEIIKTASGEVWRRQVTKDKETFAMWNHGKLSFKSETLFTPERHHIDTPNGIQLLHNVSRIEQSWSRGVRTREKYTFRNPISMDKSISMIVSLNTGSLNLKYVEDIVTTFEDSAPTESIYRLRSAMNIKIDIPGSKAVLEDIVRVRSFVTDNAMHLSFESNEGDQYIIFTGNRGPDGLVSSNVRPPAQRPVDDGFGLGSEVADLILS